MSIAEIDRSWRELNRRSQVLVGLLLLPLLLVTSLTLNNLGCEFSLDRTDYEHLAQISRVYENEPVYVPMTFEFVPITYTPLYWQACGTLWKLTGPGFLPARLVSLVSSIVVFWLVARWLWDATGQDALLTTAGTVQMVLVSLFTGFWLFQINVNPLHFALTVAGFYCLRNTSARSLLTAAVCLSLGALAKQTGLAYVVAAGVFVLLKHPRRFLAYAVPALLVCGGSLALLQLRSGGAFYDIVVRENLGPPWEFGRLIREVWLGQFLGQTAILTLFSLWPLVRGGTRRAAWDRMLSPEYAMAGSGLLVASIAQPKFGSGNLHGVIGMAGLIVCGWHGLHVALQDLREPPIATRLRFLAVTLQTLVLLAPAWEQASLQRIDAADRERYTEIANVFKRGSTVLYHFPYIASSFGQAEAGHQGDEKCRWIDGKWSHANKPDFLSEPYKQQRFDYVILGASVIDQDDPTIRAIVENYSVVRQLPEHPTKPNTLMLRYPIYVLKAKRLL
jgi:hypothetical protein